MERDEVLLDHIASEAADWFTRLLEPDVSAEDRAEFTRWMLRSPDHIHEYMAIVRAWGDINFVQDEHLSPEVVTRKALAAPLPSNVVALEREQTVPVISDIAVAKRRGRGRPWRTYVPRTRLPRLLAAVAVVACLPAVWLVGNHWLYPSHIQTAIGERRAVPLADGSVIELNTDSEVRVDFKPDERRIQLIHGEARFAVAKNRVQPRPFVVMTANARVRAIGTVFNVRQTDGQTSVAVFEGRVAVGRSNPIQATAPHFAQHDLQVLQSADSHTALDTTREMQAKALSPPTQMQLSAGERATVPARGEILPNTGPPLEQSRSWPDGRLVFREDTIETLVAEVNRYHPHPISIADPNIARVRISGTFSASDLDSFFEYLQKYCGIHAQLTEDGGYVLSRAVH